MCTVECDLKVFQVGSSRRWTPFRRFARYSTPRSHTWVLRSQIRLLTRPSDGADEPVRWGCTRGSQARCRAVAVRQHAHGGTRGAPQRDSDRSAHRCHALRRDKDGRCARCAGSQRPTAGCAPIARGWLPLCSLQQAHGDDGEGRACA